MCASCAPLFHITVCTKHPISTRTSHILEGVQCTEQGKLEMMKPITYFASTVLNQKGRRMTRALHRANLWEAHRSRRRYALHPFLWFVARRFVKALRVTRVLVLAARRKFSGPNGLLHWILTSQTTHTYINYEFHDRMHVHAPNTGRCLQILVETGSLRPEHRFCASSPVLWPLRELGGKRNVFTRNCMFYGFTKYVSITTLLVALVAVRRYGKFLCFCASPLSHSVMRYQLAALPMRYALRVDPFG